MKNKAILFYIIFAVLMFTLGASDAARGVFSPIFQGHFGLRESQLSLFISVSYIGNLVFMLCGSALADRFGIRRVFLVTMSCFILAIGLYLFTDHYLLLLIGVFFAMGTSTLLNILMNLSSPLVFTSASMLINTLFFVQGIGTSVMQTIVSARVTSFSHWKWMNAAILVLAIGCMIGFYMLSMGMDLKREQTKNRQKTSLGVIFQNKAFFYLTLAFGLYFVGEHGVMNWMKKYSLDVLMFTQEKTAIISSLLFMGIMLGRLLLAPLVKKIGMQKSLLLFYGSGAVFFLLAFLIGGNGFYFLFVSGFFFSIVYPTMTMSITMHFEADIAATATGVILAAATIFDILFNLVFGFVIESIGYHAGMKILAAAMVLGAVVYGMFYYKRVVK